MNPPHRNTIRNKLRQIWYTRETGGRQGTVLCLLRRQETQNRPLSPEPPCLRTVPFRTVPCPLTVSCRLIFHSPPVNSVST